MEIRVWKTGHQIADTVAESLIEGFGQCPSSDIAIGYGILRGMDSQLRKHKHWFNVDNGYFNPGHYQGYYRISYKGTQALWHDNAPTQSDAFNIQPFRDLGEYALICPPTDAVCAFYNVNIKEWCNYALAECKAVGLLPIFRTKQDMRSLAEMLGNAAVIITFNSSVGWEAIRLGIPCLSDPIHSTIGSYYSEKTLEPLIDNFRSYSRERLFAFMRAHQFTLSEIRAGKAWEILKHYLSISAGIAGKQSAAT